MEEGKIVSAIPKVTRRSKYGINWDSYAILARQTGQPVLAGRDIRNSQVKAIRQYNREPYVSPEGHIAVRLRNSHVDADGKRYGDVYFEWIPEEDDDDVGEYIQAANTTNTNT